MEKKNSDKRKYRKYDASFKSDAVSQLKSGRSAKELSQLLGVSESLLYKWKNDSTGGRNKEQSDELKRLRRKLKEIEEENTILKKALRIFSRSG
jgi:transposase